MDAALAQMISLGFEVEASNMALAKTKNLQEAIELIVQKQHVPNSKEEKPPVMESRNRWNDDEFDGDDEERWNRKEAARQGASSSGSSFQAKGQKVMSVASGITSSMFSKASTLFDASKKKLAPALSDIKAKIQEAAQTHGITSHGQHHDMQPEGFTTIGAGAFSDDPNTPDADDDEPPAHHNMRPTRTPTTTPAQGTAVHTQHAPRAEAPKATTVREENLLGGFADFSSASGSSSLAPSQPTFAAFTDSAPVTTKQLHSQPPAKSLPTRTQRTHVHANPDQLTASSQQKDNGNKAFKLGQFGEAIDHYSRAIECLPVKHASLVPLYNNRAMAHLKNDAPKLCISDCNEVLDILGVPSASTGNAFDSEIRDAPQVDFSEFTDSEERSQLGKAYTRRASAYEALEKYKEASADWKVVLTIDPGATMASVGMQRCGKLARLGDQPIQATSSSVKTTSSSSHDQPFEDLFDPIKMSTPIAPLSTPADVSALVENSEAVEKMRQKSAQKEAEDDEKLRLKDDIDAKVTYVASDLPISLLTLFKITVDQFVEAREGTKLASIVVIPRHYPVG
jgi:hypothetical protein